MIEEGPLAFIQNFAPGDVFAGGIVNPFRFALILVDNLFFVYFSNRAGSRTFRQKKNSAAGDHGRNVGGGAGITLAGGNASVGGVATNANGVCILPPEAAGTLGSGDLKQAVRLPTGEDLCEWVAVNSKPQGTDLCSVPNFSHASAL